jgi:hypothetical protein
MFDDIFVFVSAKDVLVVIPLFDRGAGAFVFMTITPN